MTRSCNRARTTERGFALIAAIVLAVLYFALMELLLMDSSRELAEAQRFKARILAETLAENAAERVALNMATTADAATLAPEELTDGWIYGKMSKAGTTFDIEGRGETTGILHQKAWVKVRGRLEGTKIVIDFTQHSQ